MWNSVTKSGLLSLGLYGLSLAIPVQDLASSRAAEGVPNGNGPHVLLAAPPSGTAIDRSSWTVTCDSAHAGNECVNAIDGSTSTFWHTEYGYSDAPLPHTITIDMKTTQNVNGVAMLPRQDGIPNGFIASHQVFLSTDGTNFGSPVAYGTWYGDSEQKFANFETKQARYVRLVALSEVNGRAWTSIADLNVYAASSYTAPPSGVGTWGPTIDFPIVPVAASVQPSGKVVVWSSYAKDAFGGSPGGYTLTATFDPSTGAISQRNVSNTQHDMFCPGISIDANGRTVVTGGNNAPRTSIYDPNSDSWISAPDMVIPRGYQSSATCADGRVFTIGGSWSGGRGGKNGEIYDPSANKWTLLPQCDVTPMLTNDSDPTFRADNHAWLFGWKQNTVFQAGPSKAMNWYTMTGTGGVKGAGLRGSDGDSMCGVAVMYDAVAGKILSAGGAPDYQGTASTKNGNIITLGTINGTASATATGNTMTYNRIFHNAVILPNGETFITGGQQVGEPFAESTVQLTPEMYSPSTNRFRTLVPNSIPRVYHSFALLLPDATVLSGGGGLCGSCSTNRFDAQIYTPQYLLTSSGAKATRPVINSVSATSVKVGNTLTIKTDSAVNAASLIRFGSSTHTVNTDQRRIALSLTSAGTNTYTVTVPSDAGVAMPGYWMLFVLNSSGVPSVSKTVKVTLT